MSDEIDELGPVDYLVVEFPADRADFSGAMAEQLLALADAGTIRVLDLIVLRKDSDGGVEAYEMDDIPELDELRGLEADLAELLAEEDVENLAAAIDPGSTAAVLVWENAWAAPFASSIRHSGGQLVATGRIPIQALAAQFEAENDSQTEPATTDEGA
ncbi:MAG: DUF6325 family protein [Microthrixaceae bacterium]|nr:DUF1269 domain-containing protein [Microthrixaceae bacterium]MCO5316957.1 DUF6325 family protein [Microthrixaceae bacterium]